MSQVDSGIVDSILQTIIENFSVQERDILADPYEEVGEEAMVRAIKSREIIELSPTNQSDYIIKDWPEEFPIVWWVVYNGTNKRVDVVFKGECYIWTNQPWWDRAVKDNEKYHWYMRRRHQTTKFRLVKTMVPLWVQLAAMYALNGMPWPRAKFGEQNEVPGWHERPYHMGYQRSTWSRRRRYW